MDKFVIKNKSGTLLSLPMGRNHLKMKPNEQIDLCSLTGMGVDELQRHPQIVRNIGYNNIVVVEKNVGTKIPDVSELSVRLDKLADIISNQKVASGITKEDLIDALRDIKISGDSQPASSNFNEKVVSEEDRLRQELLRRQADSFDPETKNTGTFGKNTQSIEVEDMSDLLGDLGD